MQNDNLKYTQLTQCKGLDTSNDCLLQSLNVANITLYSLDFFFKVVCDNVVGGNCLPGADTKEEEQSFALLPAQNLGRHVGKGVQ